MEEEELNIADDEGDKTLVTDVAKCEWLTKFLDTETVVDDSIVTRLERNKREGFKRPIKIRLQSKEGRYYPLDRAKYQAFVLIGLKRSIYVRK